MNSEDVVSGGLILLGIGAIVAAIWILAGWPWALLGAGIFLFLCGAKLS